MPEQGPSFWTVVTKEVLDDSAYLNVLLNRVITETPEEREQRRLASIAAYNALPWRTRVLKPKVDDILYRIGHAWRALRGEHCEWD